MDSPTASNSDNDGWSTLMPKDEEADEASVIIHAFETDGDEREDVASVYFGSKDEQTSEFDNAPEAERETSKPKPSDTLAILEQRSALTETKKKRLALTRKAARETDRIAAALSQEMSLPYSNYRKSNPTPEQSFAKCERYRDEAHRLYKRLDREAYAK
jgi:hypothetical protein